VYRGLDGREKIDDLAWRTRANVTSWYWSSNYCNAAMLRLLAENRTKMQTELALQICRE